MSRLGGRKPGVIARTSANAREVGAVSSVSFVKLTRPVVD
jgi:hypothetical protein